MSLAQGADDTALTLSKGGILKHSINITGSSIGAMAVGQGATASGSTGGKPTSKLRFTFEAKGATREQIAKWLRTAADAVEDDYCPAFAKTVDGASRAWNLEADRPFTAPAETPTGAAGDWMPLRDLLPGTVFETKDGIRAVKSEYALDSGGCLCILLASGEFAHFGKTPKEHDSTPVRVVGA